MSRRGACCCGVSIVNGFVLFFLGAARRQREQPPTAAAAAFSFAEPLPSRGREHASFRPHCVASPRRGGKCDPRTRVFCGGLAAWRPMTSGFFSSLFFIKGGAGPLMNAAEQGKRERAASLYRPGQPFARLYTRYYRAAKTVGRLCTSEHRRRRHGPQGVFVAPRARDLEWANKEKNHISQYKAARSFPPRSGSAGARCEPKGPRAVGRPTVRCVRATADSRWQAAERPGRRRPNTNTT